MALGIYSSKQILDSIYSQETDPATAPGVVGPGALWLKPTSGALLVRDTDDAAWVSVNVGTVGLLVVTSEFAQNTAGGGLTAATWNTRVLNTVRVNTLVGASLAANRITLPAGTFDIDAVLPAFAVDRNQTRLFDTTNAAIIFLGGSGMASSTSSAQYPNPLRGRFTTVGVVALEVQHNCQTTQAVNGQGLEANLTTEVYSQVTIRRVA